MASNSMSGPNHLSASVNVDPILSLNTKNLKNDILLFKNETLKDFKDAQKKISEKYNTLNSEVFQKLQAYEKRIEAYELKINELSKLISTDKTIREKIDKLIEFKEKINDSITTEKIRLDNTRNDLNSNINRIDDILKDSVIYPGIVGGISKYKTFHDLIDYVLTQCSLNLTFREKSILDLKSYKTKLDSIISSFNTQINTILNTSSEYTKTAVKECEERMQSIYNIYDDRLQDSRLENANYAVGLEKATDVLKKELENLYVIKNELYEKVDNGINEMKTDNNRIVKLFSGYKKGFNLLQHKFTQLSDFIKDVRFRLNLKEDVSRREYTHMSDMINFDKRKKGFMDGVYNDRSFLPKNTESHLKGYISGKITIDDLYKKKDTKTIKSTNNINQIEAFKRNSLSGMIKIKDASKSFSSDNMRNSMSLPKKSFSIANHMLKNTNKVESKKEVIKEEEEENNNASIIEEYDGKDNIDSIIKTYEDAKIYENNTKKENKIQIISKDKENKDNIYKVNNEVNNNNINDKLKSKASLKNVINDIFNVKNIINNIKNNPNVEAIDNKINKSEKKINGNINSNNFIKDNNKNIIGNSNNINTNKKDNSYGKNRNTPNSIENESFHIYIRKGPNKRNGNLNNNKSSSMGNFRTKSVDDQNSNVNIHVMNSTYNKFENSNLNQKVNNRDNIKLISGQIKKKLLNNKNRNNFVVNNDTIKAINNQLKMNKNNKNVSNMINKVDIGYGIKDEKNTENFILNNYIPRNDINVDENNFMKLKKKNNL